MTKWTEALDPASLDLSDVDEKTFKSDFQVPEIARELEFISLSLFDKAPAVGEALAVIFSLGGKKFEHPPIELPFPIGGTHLGAIGARRMTPKQDWFVHLQVNGGETWDFLSEALDVVASDAFADVTLGWSTEPLGKPTVFSLMDRETAVTGVANNTLGSIDLVSATKIVEAFGYVVPAGTTTADMPIGGRILAKSATLTDQKEISFGIEPMEGIEATSGQMGAPSIYRAPQDIDILPNNPTPKIKANYLPGQAVTTQLALATWGLRYWK